MAVIKGSEGHATYASITTGIKNWSVSETAAEIDTTPMADGGVTDATYTTGLHRWTATITLEADDGVTYASLRAGISATLTLVYKDAGAGGGAVDGHYTGTALVTDITHGATVDDDSVQPVTLTLRGTGALTYQKWTAGT